MVEDNDKIDFSRRLSRIEQIRSALSSAQDRYFWVDELNIFSAPKIVNASFPILWAVPPDYPDNSKWEERLFANFIPMPSQINKPANIATVLIGSFERETNNPHKLRERAAVYARLEWQLLALTYWASPEQEPPKNWEQKFDLLSSHRAVLRGCAIEALCYYEQGGHKALNDYRKYGSLLEVDVYYAEQFESAFNKTYAAINGYLYHWNKSVSATHAHKDRVNNDSLDTRISKHPVKSWIRDMLEDDPKINNENLWGAIGNLHHPTATPCIHPIYVENDRLYILGSEGKGRKRRDKGIAFGTFEGHITEVRKLLKNND